MGDWVSFWDTDNSIYVNARHKDVHYARVADDIRAALQAILPEPEAANVLDYGCGEALHAERVAALTRRLILCEAAPKLRASLAERYNEHANIAVWSPAEAGAAPSATFDAVVLHSVAQYLAPAEADRLFALFRRLLRPGGVLIVGDVVPPDLSPLADAQALLRFARANGFLTAALRGLATTALSDYARLRARIGLTRYAERDMLAKLAAAGFAAERWPTNLGHNRARMTFVARAPGG